MISIKTETEKLEKLADTLLEDEMARRETLRKKAAAKVRERREAILDKHPRLYEDDSFRRLISQELWETTLWEMMQESDIVRMAEILQRLQREVDRMASPSEGERLGLADFKRGIGLLLKIFQEKRKKLQEEQAAGLMKRVDDIYETYPELERRELANCAAVAEVHLSTSDKLAGASDIIRCLYMIDSMSKMLRGDEIACGILEIERLLGVEGARTRFWYGDEGVDA